MTPGIALASDGPVATLTLDRPGKRNAIGLAAWQAIPRLIAEACARAETRVIVLGGAGGHFAAGADIGEFATVFADRAATLDYLATMTAATASIANAPLPVIARIDGLCIGAGVALAAACDLRLAADDATFAITPGKLGLAYSLTDTARVMALIGPGHTSDLLFTGRMIDATTARAIGLIEHTHPAADLAAAVAAKAAQIAANSAWSHAHNKQIVARILAGSQDDDDTTRAWFAEAPHTADFREGSAAFSERRPPRFPPRDPPPR